MTDNPCWGGCESNQHDLEYLLRVLGSSSSSSTLTSTSTIAAAAAAAAAAEQQQQQGYHSKNAPPPPLNFSTFEQHASFLHRVHTQLIIYHDEHYIVLHKPPDLRIDGPYEATVHKLLLYLFPPPSLLNIVENTLKECTMKNKNDDNTEQSHNVNNDEKHPSTTILQQQQQLLLQQNHNHLLRAIYPLSSHSSIPDDPFRLVHQLDYATSGVLLIGKTRKATATACKSFEERKTIKKYVAVVTTKEGSSSSPRHPPLGHEFFNNLPMLNSSSLDAWCDGSLEKLYRKKRQRETNNTVRYLPIHSVFDKWRSTLIRRRKREREEGEVAVVEEEDGVTLTPTPPSHQLSRKSHINDDLLLQPPPPPPLPNPKVILTCEEEKELLSLGTSWKAVKSNILEMGGGGGGSENAKNKWIDIVETMTVEYNQALGKYYTEQNITKDCDDNNNNNNNTGKNAIPVAASSGLSLPPMFRISSNENHITSESNEAGANNDPNNTSFYICASIGEIKGRFHVIVDPSISLSQRDKMMNSSNMNSIGGGGTTTLPPLRPALTKCTVLSQGYYYCPSTSHNNNNANQRKRIPVAKVLLQPWTGRRHQLRVHLASIVGCPILGDVAYDGSGDDDVDHPSPIKIDNNGSTVIKDTDKTERRTVCRRMCLHAKELTIPLLGGVSKTFAATDPFIFEDEELVIL